MGALAAFSTFVGLTGISAAVALVRIGLGIYGGVRQTVPRGELQTISSALSIEQPKHWLVVTDHRNHDRAWRNGRAASLNSPPRRALG